MDKASATERVEIAIIGGGFSGSMVAIHLARLFGSTPPKVALFERGDRFARGVAYGTRSERHLLNVPAGLMSAFPDEPGHFLQWLCARDPSAHAGTFASRASYGDYLSDLMDETMANSAMRLELVRGDVVSIQRDGETGPFRIVTCTRRTIAADRVVLAVGHQAPQGLAGWDGRPGPGAHVADPWSPGALRGLVPDEPIALIGTGLTAVDLVVEARSIGHRGTIHAISRHGLMPFRHPSAPVAPRPHFTVPAAGESATARGLVRELRAEAAACKTGGGDWRSVVDSVRPVAQTLWGSLGDGERRRFLRHLAPRWDVHRHRLAPAIDDEVQAARGAGQLQVLAARVLGFRDEGGRVAVSLRRRGSDESEALTVRRVINCTGPGRDILAGSSPLIQSILAEGLGRPGPLSVGLDVTDSGSLVGADGVEHKSFFAIGPLLKEQLWETTAVRELRAQAQSLAGRLLNSSGSQVKA